MADFLSPGLKSTQVRKGPAVIKATSATSVGGFMAPAQMGPIATPTKLTGPGDFKAIFGDSISGSYGAEETAGFFKNGGQQCYFTRIAHYTTISSPTGFDAAAALLQLQDAGSVNTIMVKFSSPCANGNNYKITTLRTDTLLTSIAVALVAGAITYVDLTNASRVRVGDQLTLTDGVHTMVIVVTSINGNRVFCTATVPVGGVSNVSSTVTLNTLRIQVIGPDGSIAKQWDNLRMSPLSTFAYFQSVINSTYRTPITVTDNASVTADPRPANIVAVPLASGVDANAIVDADIVGNQAAKTGIYAMDQKSDYGMLSIPGYTSAASERAQIDYSESRKIAMAVLDVPQGSSPSGAVTHVGTTVNDYSSFALFYYPWVHIVSTLDGTTISTPSCGFIQGMIARTDANRGVWKAPAGIVDGQIAGIVGTDYDVQQPDYDLLYPAKINAIQTIPNQGICAMGNITLDPTGEFGELNVQRLFIYVGVSLNIGLRWVNFEPNNSETRARVVRTVRAFLRQIWKAGGLGGGDSSKMDDAFFIQCDGNNNDAVVRAARKLKVRIGLAAVHAAEFIDQTLEQDTRAIDAALAA